MASNKLFLLIAGLFITSACSQQNLGSVSQPADKTAAILGGSAVTNDDPISKSTALLLDVQTGKKAGHTVITGLAMCTATVLSDSIVLSAGHCSDKDPKHLFLVFSTQIPSDWKAFFQGIQTNPLVRRIEAGVTAPNWKNLGKDTKDNWGDVSLLRFSGGLPEGIVTATLASSDLALSATEAITLAGFGETDGVAHTEATQLMKVDVQIADPNYSDTEMKIDNTNGKGACHGDSGGPAYVKANDGSLILTGVTSRADIATDPKGVCIGKTIYTKVQSYLDWITTESNKLNADASYGTQIDEPADF